MRIYFRAEDVARVWKHAGKHELDGPALKLRFDETGEVQLRAAGGGSYAKAHAVVGYAQGILPTSPFHPGDAEALLSGPYCVWEVTSGSSAAELDQTVRRRDERFLIEGKGKRWAMMTWGSAASIQD